MDQNKLLQQLERERFLRKRTEALLQEKEMQIQTQQKQLQDTLQACKETTPDIYIRQEGKLLRVPLNTILFFETIGDYIRIKTADSAYLIHNTLKGIEEKIQDPRFLKVHRSFIVNLEKISEISEHGLTIDSNAIPVSRANRPVLLNRLKIL